MAHHVAETGIDRRDQVRQRHANAQAHQEGRGHQRQERMQFEARRRNDNKDHRRRK